jgi:hypothetical protein
LSAPGSITGSGSLTLTVNSSNSNAKGNYTVAIKGTSGSLVHSTSVSLKLN